MNKKTEEKNKKWKERIGKTFGIFTILEITDYMGEPRGNVKCNLCGNTSNMVLARMVNQPPKKCMKCRRKKNL